MLLTRKQLDMDVVTAAKKRLKNVFSNGVPVTMSFSGGKDSLCLAGLVDELARAGEPSGICVLPQGNRYYRLFNDIDISVVTDDGTFKFFFKAMFMTNFRSGGVLIDKIIDQIGDLLQQVAYLCHDAAYTPCAALKMEHPVSRKLADELLRAVLVKCGMGKFKASLVYNSVRLFGKSAYEKDDDLTETNSKLFNFEWSAEHG